MNRSISCLITIVGSVCGVGIARGDVIPPQPVGGKIQWIYNYTDGQKLARESGKPLFVVFRCER